MIFGIDREQTYNNTYKRHDKAPTFQVGALC